MALTPGNKILRSDLETLAALANAKGVYGTDPQTGYVMVTGFEIVYTGLGYLVGDVLTLAGSVVTFEVEEVGEYLGRDGDTRIGLIVGLRLLNNGPLVYDAGTFNPTLDLMGGSGDAGRVKIVVAAYDPLRPYVFPEYLPAPGQMCGSIVQAGNGGSGYRVGDVLTVGTMPDATVDVLEVTASGAVLLVRTNWPNAAVYSVVSQSSLVPAVGGSGTGAKLTLVYTLAQKPGWLAELNRLRTNLMNSPVLGLNYIPAARLYCSGAAPGVGWPKSGLTGWQGFDKNSSYQEFYFADTGRAETITLAATGGVSPGVTYAQRPPPGVGYYATGTIPNAYAFSGVMLPGVIGGWAAGPFNDEYEAGGEYVGGIYTNSPRRAITSIVYRLKIKNPPGTTFSGQFSFRVDSASRTFNNPDGDYWNTNTPSLTVESNLGNFTASVIGGNGYCKYVCNAVGLPDGDYHVNVTGGFVSAVPQYYTLYGIQHLYWLVNYCVLGALANDSLMVPSLVCDNGTFLPNAVFSAVPTAGIHNAKQIYKIPLTGLDGQANVGCGITTIYRQPLTGDYGGAEGYSPTPAAPYCAPAFGPEQFSGPSFTTTITISNGTQGFWVGSLPLVNNLNVATPALMPWNLRRLKTGALLDQTVNPSLLGDLAPQSPPNYARVSNSYDQMLPVEMQAEPPLWLASRYFSAGFTIQDSNGNFQQVVTAGTTGSRSPFWSNVLNASTTDGSVLWSCVRVLPPKQSLTPAVHRSAAVPRYPVYWYNETVAALKPPTSTSGLTIWGAYSQWQDQNLSGGKLSGWQQSNLALGWWIYSVTLNRSRAVGSVTPEIGVTIGCLRNGSFVAFGSYVTGRTLQVLWPVFTSDALVYQCSERIDVQAVAISTGGIGVSTGAVIPAGYPMAAVFASDPQTILNLFP